MTRSAHRALSACAGVALVSALAGCNDNDLGLERRHPNRPPETILSSTPPDSTYDTVYTVQLFWSGADPDGTIDHFDFILLDHPADQDSINSGPSDPNRVLIEVPGHDDPRWVATSGNDTTIVSRADTLRRDPRPPMGSSDPQIQEHNRLVRMQNFERWHTFFVRAVDNEGEIDPTPEYVSFNSTTLAPTVALQTPINPAAPEFQGPQVIVFNWTGSDPVGDGTFIDPIASRWVIVPVSKDTQGRYVGFPWVLHDIPPVFDPNSRYNWSIWRRWDAADGSGKRAIVSGLQPVTGPTVGFYLFAVQAMDEAGAVTPVFDAHTPGSNNVAKVSVIEGFGATLIVEEPFLGQYSFAGASRPVPIAVATGQPVQFRWRGDASAYGGDIVAYRYGWNILNTDNDEEWEQNWCQTCTISQPRVFTSGVQRFFVETRDNAGTVTHAELELTVHQVNRRRELLLVDDTANFPDDAQNQEILEDQRWLSIIESLQAIRPFSFDSRPGADLYDVVGTFQQPPQISKVFDYKTVVWYSKVAGSDVALRRLALFFDPFVPRNQNRFVDYNYLATYIENGGEFWLSGAQPTSYLWEFAPGQAQLYPFNVTNWDDPMFPHPQEDSVGVRSFLWRFGAEAVDQGGGGRAPVIRQPTSHYCIGFRRATPQGYERQTFTSSTVEDHEHTVNVLTADVDTPPMTPVTYTTASASGSPHTHTVTLTPEQLQALSRGERVDGIETSEAALPQPHTHIFDFVDQVGLWGAPARLEPERANWAQPTDPAINPAGGRPSIEIYNMVQFMNNQSPRLNPDPQIWEALYTYISPTPADANTLYPQTADGQPAIILRRATRFDPYYSRAMCGFEIWRLQRASHLALADFILLRHFRLGLPD